MCSVFLRARPWGVYLLVVDCQMMRVRLASVISNANYITKVEGSTKVMVTVVATQELKPGDTLLRFKSETAQDEPRRGND